MAAKFPDIEVVGRPTKWQTELAANAAQTVLSADPDIDAIYLQSEAVMLPAILNTLIALTRIDQNAVGNSDTRRRDSPPAFECRAVTRIQIARHDIVRHWRRIRGKTIPH